MNIVPIVEGHGDVEAVPVLLRRLAAATGRLANIMRPIRQPRSRLVKPDGLERAVELAALKGGADGAILVVLDADDDCAAQLGPRMLAWAMAARADRAIAVVLAVREFEAWFLAAADSLRVAGKLPAATTPPSDPEAIRDAKGWLSRCLARRYDEPVDQPAFAALFDLTAARRCASFDKLVRDVERLLAGN